LLSKEVNKYASSFSKKFVIPNNDKKYYLLIVNDNKKYTTLYFFPDLLNEIHNKLDNYKQSDFFMEIEKCFDEEFLLLEGYLYNTNNVSNNKFLITDVLYIGKDVVDCDYHLRFGLIQKLLSKQKISNLNCSMDISIHPVFEYEDETTENYLSLLTIFKNNFMYKKEISSLEFVNSNILQKKRKTKQYVLESSSKIVKKTKYIDVYNVFNITNQNNEGILYIKGIRESKHMRKIFEANSQNFIEMHCDYNNDFQKWYPILC
jgi:hypothetical protein